MFRAWFLSASLQKKVALAFTVPLACVVLFNVTFFSAKSRGNGIESAREQIRTLREMLGFSVGAALKESNFDLLQTSFTWAKQDPRIRYIAILDESATPIVEYNPDSARVDRSLAASDEPRMVELDDVVIASMPARYNGQRYGTVIISYSLKELQEAGASQFWTSIAISLILGAAGLGIAIWLIVTFIVRRVRAIAERMDNANLSMVFSSTERDEIGQLTRSFDNFIGSIRDALIKVSEVSSAVASASAEISASAEEMSAGAREQSAQAEGVTRSIQEMARTITANSQNATDAANVAREARGAAEQGGRVVGDTVEEMKRIAEIVRQSSHSVEELGSSSDQIGAIAGVIDDIADQTNLLALNAAIEAARAGEQGRGFAVVADEVRKLAERTTKATKEIAEMIRKIQVDTAAVVNTMQSGTQQVNSGIHLADQARTSMQEIVKENARATEMVSAIAAASDKQTEESDHIAASVDAISKVTSESALGISQIARTSEDLNRLTLTLQELIEQFKLSALPGLNGRKPGITRNELSAVPLHSS